MRLQLKVERNTQRNLSFWALSSALLWMFPIPCLNKLLQVAPVPHLIQSPENMKTDISICGLTFLVSKQVNNIFTDFSFLTS